MPRNTTATGASETDFDHAPQTKSALDIARTLVGEPTPVLWAARDSLERRARLLRATCDELGVTLLASVKALPCRELLSAALSVAHGPEAANCHEIARAAEIGVCGLMSVTGPMATPDALRDALAEDRWSRVFINANTWDHFRAFSELGRPGLVAGVRLSGREDSRFGVPPQALLERLGALPSKSARRPLGLHIYDRRRTIEQRAELLANVSREVHGRTGSWPAYLNLGGNIKIDGLDRLRSAVGMLREETQVEQILIEPGELWTDGLVFCLAKVLASHEERRSVIIDASIEAHFRYRRAFVISALDADARPDTVAEPAEYCGPTCIEADRWGMGPSGVRPGDHVVIEGLSGYAIAWNTNFNGVAPANVRIVGDE